MRIDQASVAAATLNISAMQYSIGRCCLRIRMSFMAFGPGVFFIKVINGTAIRNHDTLVTPFVP